MSYIDNSTLRMILSNLLQGRGLKMVYDMRRDINDYIVFLMNKEPLNKNEVDAVNYLLQIGNITYNNLDTDMLPIEDGMYDLLIEKYRKYNNDTYPVGAPPVVFDMKDISNMVSTETTVTTAFSVMNDEDIHKMDDMLFPEILERNKRFSPEDFINYAFTVDEPYITKRVRNVAHSHPDLVGTFDKVKYVLTHTAEEMGVANDSNVRILERDFFRPLIDKGVINCHDEYTMILTLKYDGVSVEADCTYQVESARSRGDALNSVAVDMTPILGGYQFPNAPISLADEPVGIKFEAIINNFNLQKLQDMGSPYINCRTAIIGITGSSDAYKYRDYISLVPISTDIKDENGEPLDRLVELEFLNRFYAKDELIRYSVITGNYNSLLFQIKRFVDEAEFARNYLPFMYDGVVIEFYDPEIREALGRDSAIDRYKCGIKFNAMKKQTFFREYKFEIGQDGSVTPMIYYDPVEFMGSIHPKSTGHSYKRFMDLGLRPNDIIDVTYVNDVMTYVSKPDNEYNRQNALKESIIPFPTTCPSCGEKIYISPTGKSAFCLNKNCPEVVHTRLANMFAKLGIYGFGYETVLLFPYTTLREYMEASADDFKVLGPNDSVSLFTQFNDIKTGKNKKWDYELIGSLGFKSLAFKTWQLILSHVDLKQLILCVDNNVFDQGTCVVEEFLYESLANVKGIGSSTINTILSELNYFIEDIRYIFNNIPFNSSYGTTAAVKKKVRFSGVRDKELCKQLQAMGFDASDSSLTLDTDYLVVPYEGHTSSKVSKAKEHNIQVVPIQLFRDNPQAFL